MKKGENRITMGTKLQCSQCHTIEQEKAYVMDMVTKKILCTDCVKKLPLTQFIGPEDEIEFLNWVVGTFIPGMFSNLILKKDLKPKLVIGTLIFSRKGTFLGHIDSIDRTNSQVISEELLSDRFEEAVHGIFGESIINIIVLDKFNETTLYVILFNIDPQRKEFMILNIKLSRNPVEIQNIIININDEIILDSDKMDLKVFQMSTKNTTFTLH